MKPTSVNPKTIRIAAIILFIATSASVVKSMIPPSDLIAKEIWANASFNLENTDRLNKGMSYGEVSELLGRTGVLGASKESSVGHIQVYAWNHRPYAVFATFLDGKLDSLSTYKDGQLVTEDGDKK